MKVAFALFILAVFCELSTQTIVEKAFLENEIVPDMVPTAPSKTINVGLDRLISLIFLNKIQLFLRYCIQAECL